MPAEVPALLALLLLLLAVRGGGAPGAEQLVRPPARIGVIGAGVGGTAAAYFLRQKFGGDVPIDVFERGDVGGRLATVNVDGQDYEAGGSILHPLNLLTKQLVKELGLSALPSQGGLLGFHNGEELVFAESSWYVWTFLKRLWYYGLNHLRMSTWVEENLEKFMRIYRYQAHDFAFSSNEGLLHALGGASFTHLLNQTMGEAMQEAGFSQKFIDEIAVPIMQFSFGQGVDLNALVGIIALTVTDPGLWSVEGGNKLLCNELLSASKAQLIPGTVLSVEEKTPPKGGSSHPANLYEVTYLSEAGITTALYDVLLIATPLQPEIADIHFHSFNPPIPDFSRRYHQTVTTLVQGRLNATFFGYQDPSQFELSSIFSMDNPKLFINSIDLVSPVKKTTPKQPLGPPVWRVFSPEPLTEEQLSLLFSSYGALEEKMWLAYPQYSPPGKSPPIILHTQLYYLSGIEWTASCIEMNVIAAKNAALLAHHRWYKKVDKVDQEDLQDRLKTEL